MKVLDEYIKDLINEFLDNEIYFIVDVIVSANQNIVVYVDKIAGNIEISTCAKLSRFIENDLETNNLVKDNYKIEVSSPGLDNAFKVHQQYVKNIGKQVDVWDKDNNKLEGELIKVDEQEIVLKQKIGKNKKAEFVEMKLKFENIGKTKVKISFKK